MSNTTRHIRARLEPEGRELVILPGTALVEAAGEAGVVLETPCGGTGKCGRCRVRFLSGAPEPTPAEKDKLSVEELANGWRLGCECVLTEDCRLEVREDIRISEAKVVLAVRAGDQPALKPGVRKAAIQPVAASLESPVADLERVLACLDDGEHTRVPLAIIRELPEVLSDGPVTATLSGGEILTLECNDTSARMFGLAVDVGTTTVAGILVDLRTGTTLRVASRTNPQSRHGADVVSRIAYAGENADGLQTLQREIAGCVNEIIDDLCRGASVSREDIYDVVFVGNTAMNHLLLQINPAGLGECPYAPVVSRAVTVPATELGITVHARARAYCFPNVAGFVGGDTVGVILAAGMHRRDKLRLAVDIGTNGEMALGSSKGILCCSTAAGPAFEGARIRFGMRAAPGAVDKVRIGDDVEVNVIGGTAARGICGTALIDLVAELLRVGVIDETGRIVDAQELPDSVSAALRARLTQVDDAPAFVLLDSEETEDGQAIVLTQRDVREVQLAKAAIFAGIQILLKEAGVTLDDVHEVLLAGAFGNFIRRSMAKRIGLLPDIPTERIRFVGNAAGEGAEMALLNTDCRREAEEIARNTRYLELATKPDFQMEFASAMMFATAEHA